jgi:ribosomal peptide maturation radical SAM protein 1
MIQANEKALRTSVKADRSRKILLVVPPFGSVVMSNLGVAQLKSSLERAGHPTEVLHLNFHFAQRLGLRTSEYLTTSPTWSTQICEFVFSAALFGEKPGQVDDFLNDVLAGDDALRFLEREYRDPPATVITRWREEAIGFCDGEGLDAILERDAWLVGFSSTFQQNCASLALIERLKRKRPEVFAVMGGANCEDEMGEELFARFPAIDYVGQGECDHSLVALADALSEGKTGSAIPGMLSREAPLATVPGRPLSREDMDDLPFPDFDDFVAQREALQVEEQRHAVITMETSRGCWWGAKHHCTFCGLNGESMGYRSKSPRRVLDEIDWLINRYGPRLIHVTDCILDMKYFKEVMPTLAEWKRTTLFFETKANLNRDQVRILADARVNGIQPGIESLSDESLRLMRKGVTKVQCVELLRLCAEYGVEVAWNYLIGFPGENDDELTGIADEIESLHHLEPPKGFGVLQIHRFSPYYNTPEEFGLSPITPIKAYRHVYPFPPESLARIAYYFESDVFNRKKKGRAAQVVAEMVKRWTKVHSRASLVAIPRRKSLFIVDTRPSRLRRIHRLRGLRRSVYEYCDHARGLTEITREIGANATSESIEQAIESLVRDRLILAGSDRYLSLGVRPGETRTVDSGPIKRHLLHDLSLVNDGHKQGAGLLLSPRVALRRFDTRLRKYRRSVGEELRRRTVQGLGRLIQEPEQKDDAVSKSAD